MLSAASSYAVTIWDFFLRVRQDQRPQPPQACLPAEFVQLVASEANTVSEEDKKKTLNPEHVISALERLGLSPFLDGVKAMWAEVKDGETERSEHLHLPLP